MSSNNYTGTLSIGSTDYAVTGVVARRGRQLLGTLRFVDDETKEIPINLKLNAAYTTFSSTGTQWFQLPTEEVVALLSVGSGFTSTDPTLENFTISDTPIEVDGNSEILSLDISIEVEESEVEGLESEAAVIKTEIEGTLVPFRINEIGNHMDHFAGILSLKRNVGETNEELLGRLERKLAKKTDSSFRGLSEAIPLSVGLQNQPAIRIRAKASSPNKEKSAFVLRRDRLIIYSSWLQIELQEEGARPTVEIEQSLEGLSIGNLVDLINTSAYFTAVGLSNLDKPASFLIPTESHAFSNETLQPSERMNMLNRNILKNYFSVLLIRGLVREVEDREEISRWGDYWVDYESGSIFSFSQPDGEVKVCYIYNQEDFEVEYSSVIVLPLKGEDFENLYFNQIIQNFYTSEYDREINGMPKYLGYDIIRKIMTAGKFPQFWGE